jgi:nucleoid-associated protein YgaU
VSRVRLQLALVGLGAAGAVAVLLRAGHGTLAGPRVDGWASVEVWYDAVGAATAAVATLRLLAIGLAAWLLLCAVLQLAGTFSPLRAIRPVADVVSPQGLQCLARGAAGLALTAVLVGPPAPVDPAGTAVMEALDEEEPATTSTTTDPTTTTSSTSPPAVPASGPAPAEGPGPAARPSPAPDVVVVERGDSFWSLAVDAVADDPARGEVGDYWRRLVTANRARLVDPTNPDLLYAGQVLSLPAPGG